MSKYPGLKRRGIYQLRLAVPRDLHAVFGRKEVTVSLRTSDFQKAVDRYFIEVGRLRSVFAECRNDPAGEFSLVGGAKAEAATLALPNCLMLNVPRTPDLEDKFQWVGPLDFPELGLIGKAGRDFAIHSVADASKYTIGAVRGQDAAKVLLAQGLKPGALKTDSLYIQTLRRLQDGKVDLVAFPLENATYLMRSLGMDQGDYQVAYVYKKIPLYIALSKGMSPALVGRLNEALAMYKKPMSDGNSVFDKSMARYLPYGTVK